VASAVSWRESSDSMTWRIARAWAGGNWDFSNRSRLEVFIAAYNGKAAELHLAPGSPALRR